MPDNRKDLVWAILGWLTGLFVGMVSLFVSYGGIGGQPILLPAWKVSVLDGAALAAVGVLAYLFRRRHSFVQGILFSVAILFLLNGLCGLSAR